MAARVEFAERVDNLFLEVYLIGYPSEGESILFLVKTIRDRDIILYSGVIDSCQFNGKNKTIELLQHLNIKKLDFLCWTHPDLDHSLGIDTILENYADKDTRVVLPYALLHLEDRLKNTAKELCDKVAEIFLPRKDMDKYDLVAAVPGLPVQIVNFATSTRTKPYSLNITSLSPFSRLVDSQISNQSIDNNLLSVALLFNFGGINLFFGSDIEDRTIRHFYGEIFEFPEQLHYIKIPHHASEGSRELLNFLNGEILAKVACSTPFSKCKLPSKAVLKEYEKFAEKVHCTNEISVGDIGIIATQFDVIEMGFKMQLYNDISQITLPPNIKQS